MSLRGNIIYRASVFPELHLGSFLNDSGLIFNLVR